MNDPEIIKAAIIKARFVPDELLGIPFDKLEITADEYRVQWSLRLADNLHKPLMESSVRGIIFSHEFAKGFWGEAKVDDCGYEVARLEKPIEPDGDPTFLTVRTHKTIGNNTIYTEDQVASMESSWEYHLKTLVLRLESERLKYIERFL